jgi:hypothetical protein
MLEPLRQTFMERTLKPRQQVVKFCRKCTAGQPLPEGLTQVRKCLTWKRIQHRTLVEPDISPDLTEILVSCFPPHTSSVEPVQVHAFSCNPRSLELLSIEATTSVEYLSKARIARMIGLTGLTRLAESVCRVQRNASTGVLLFALPLLPMPLLSYFGVVLSLAHNRSRIIANSSTLICYGIVLRCFCA